MRKLKGILVLVLLLALLASPIAVLASDISGARYYGTIIVSNSSTANTNVAVNCSISTQALIDGDYLNSSANNCVVHSSAGADLPFMPGVSDNHPWCIWVPSIGQDASTADILYTADSTGGKIRYFPAAGGIASSDNANMELGDNFTVEQKGWVDTSYTLADFTTYTEVDANNKLTVTATRAEAADADRDEDVYLYTDMTADYFDHLYVDFEIYIVSTSENDANCGVAITNTVDSVSGFAATDIYASAVKTGGNYRIYLYRGAGVASDFYAATSNTTYYCTLVRGSGSDTVNLLIYSNSTRLTLLDTLAVAGYGTTKYQYVFGFVNWNVPWVARDFDGYVQNLAPKIGVLVHKQGAFRTFINGSGNITSFIGTTPSVTATGVSSGEHTITTLTDNTSLFVGIGKDITDADFPIADNLTLNAPLWHSELDISPFTTKDVNEYSFTTTGALWSTDGYFFDGLNDFTTKVASTPTDNITMEAWINLDSTFATQGRFAGWSRNDSLRATYAYIADDKSGVHWVVHLSAINNANWKGTYAFATDTWYHIAITQKGPTTTPIMYVNGELISVSLFAGAGVPSHSAQPFSIGRAGDANALYFKGLIGEVRVYAEDFAQSDVRYNYNVTKWKYETSDEYFHYNLLPAGGVPDNANDWFYYQNLADYWHYTKITINSVLQQWIEWEYDTVFSDLSGHSPAHDATPTFRTTSSDPDVSAVLSSFLPVSEAQAPSYALEEAPAFIETVPTIVSEWDVVPPAGTFPLAGVIAAVAGATDTPAQLPLLIIAVFVILAFSLTVSATMRRYGSGSLIPKIIAITAVMGILIAIGNMGIDFWMLFVFLVIATALAMGSKQIGWQ